MVDGIVVTNNKTQSIRGSLHLMASSEMQDTAINYYQHYEASSYRNISNSVLLRKLQKASSVCGAMRNVSGKEELKKLLEESVILFREYQCSDEYDEGKYAAIYPSSPASSMFPQ